MSRARVTFAARSYGPPPNLNPSGTTIPPPYKEGNTLDPFRIISLVSSTAYLWHPSRKRADAAAVRVAHGVAPSASALSDPNPRLSFCSRSVSLMSRHSREVGARVSSGRVRPDDRFRGEFYIYTQLSRRLPLIKTALDAAQMRLCL